MNHVILIGRFAADPVISATATGKQLCKFALAVERPHTKETVDFIDMVAWEKLGLFVSKHFKKGQRVAVSGYLTIHKHTDKEENKRKYAEVVVENVFFADAAPAKPPAAHTEPSRDDAYNISDDEFIQMTYKE